MAPGVAPLGLGVPAYLEHFHDPIPDRLALEYLFDRDRFQMPRLAPVQPVNSQP